jgi:hypothetical protein
MTHVMKVVALLAVVMALLVGGPVAQAANIHFVGTPTCTVSAGGTQLECAGKLAGLGKAPTNVEVVADFNCTNRGGNQPPGQASGQSGPIQPSGGQITFDVTTTAAGCPDDMTPTFGSTATINVFQGNQLVFTAEVPITQA